MVHTCLATWSSPLHSAFESRAFFCWIGLVIPLTVNVGGFRRNACTNEKNNDYKRHGQSPLRGECVAFYDGIAGKHFVHQKSIDPTVHMLRIDISLWLHPNERFTKTSVWQLISDEGCVPLARKTKKEICEDLFFRPARGAYALQPVLRGVASMIQDPVPERFWLDYSIGWVRGERPPSGYTDDTRKSQYVYVLSSCKILHE
jgi:hypothetical protein